MRVRRYTQPRMADTTTRGPVPDLVGGIVVCNSTGGIVVVGGSDVAATVVVLVMFIDGAGRGVETCSSGLSV